MSLFYKLYTKILLFFINDNQVSLRCSKSNPTYKYNIIIIENKIRRNKKPCKIRTFAAASNLCGSITIEAALAVSMFLIVILSLISVLQAVHTYRSIHQVLISTGDEAAVLGEDLSGINAVHAIFVAKMLGASENTLSIVGGIGGISFLGSEVDKNSGVISLNVSYQVRPPLLMLPGLKLKMSHRIYFSLWCGFLKNSNLSDTQASERKDIYYIAEYESVYHTSAQCTHLMLSISSVSMELLSHQHNSQGARYSACEKCASDDHGAVYITENGTKYHTTLGCSGLKRTVHEVTDVRGLRACSRCGNH